MCDICDIGEDSWFRVRKVDAEEIKMYNNFDVKGWLEIPRMSFKVYLMLLYCDKE